MHKYIFTQFLIFIVVWENNPIYFLWLSVLQTNIWDSIIRRGQWDRFLRSHALQFMKFLVACCDKLASASLLDLFSSCHIATPSRGHLSRQLMTDSLEQKSFVPRIILRYGMWQMKEYWFRSRPLKYCSGRVKFISNRRVGKNDPLLLLLSNRQHSGRQRDS